jgi:AraC-like DNA-binding protein
MSLSDKDKFPAKKKRGGKEVKEYIREHYAETSAKEIAEKFGLKPSYIYSLACRLGVTKSWVNLSEKQLRIVKKEYKGESVKKLIKKLKIDILPNTLAMRINRMGLRKKKRLSDADKEYIKEHFHADPVKDIAAHLNCSMDAVRKIAKAMGLPVRNNKVFGEVMDFVRRNPAMFVKDIAAHFNCSAATVYYYIRLMGLSEEIKKERKKKNRQ